MGEAKSSWSTQMMFAKPICTARQLSDLPNISFALAGHLEKLGIHSPDGLRDVGAENAWLSVQAARGPQGIQLLLALDGAIRNLDWRDLPARRRHELVRFAATHLEYGSAA
ncbi:MAG TPA: TfoX/Sxy family protein [Opitutaceae bacterium]|nr:TfoX/Sxy family protein [Opitutaceae bacterium]